MLVHGVGGSADRARHRTDEIREGSVNLWALKWKSENALDGCCEHLMLFGKPPDRYWPTVFRTRSAARAFREEKYGYIRRRPDLRKEPHGWKFPAIVKVKIIEDQNND